MYGTHFPDNSFKETGSIIKHGLYGHLDVAGSFLDRVTIAFSLPVALYEKGTAIDGVAPLGGAAVGDPRLGIMVRAFGQPDRSPFSLNLGVTVWIPIKQDDHHMGDRTARVAPRSSCSRCLASASCAAARCASSNTQQRFAPRGHAPAGT